MERPDTIIVENQYKLEIASEDLLEKWGFKGENGYTYRNIDPSSPQCSDNTPSFILETEKGWAQAFDGHIMLHTQKQTLQECAAAAFEEDLEYYS